MSVFDRYGNFVYLNDGSLSSEEEAEEEKKRQEQLCELMSKYQHYRGIVAGLNMYQEVQNLDVSMELNLCS